MADVSIHPRVKNGRTEYPIVNTCVPPKGRVWAQERYTKRLQNWELLQKQVASNQKAAFRMPGSRNAKKLRNRV